MFLKVVGGKVFQWLLDDAHSIVTDERADTQFYPSVLYPVKISARQCNLLLTPLIRQDFTIIHKFFGVVSRHLQQKA